MSLSILLGLVLMRMAELPFKMRNLLHYGYMKQIFKSFVLKLFSPILSRMGAIENALEQSRILNAKLILKSMPSSAMLDNLSGVEFKVFSQWGEDGIIQYLISKVPIVNRVFIEFGVEDYAESNTRFLMMNNNWQGLVIDGSERHISTIKAADYYWRFNLTGVAAFITRENINKLILGAGLQGDIGILSVDIDGNDYWVWEAIDVVSPRIVICEYNAVFGAVEAVVVPYDPKFNRTRAHYSNLYCGASLKALCLLAERKGYVYVGANSAGTNAFFVRKDVSSAVKSMDCLEGFVSSNVRESRAADGTLTHLAGLKRAEIIGNEPVLDLGTNKLKLIRDIQL